MISGAYTYYLTTYGSQQVTKYDAHKKSELKNVYNKMLRVNKRSPLYMFLDEEKVQKYAIDLKESARAMKNVAASLTDDDGSISGFSKKKAVSSNPAIVDVEYIGDEEGADQAESLEVHVQKLASAQINQGVLLNPSGSRLQKGSYFFDMNIGEYTYEFSFNVREGEDNEDVQDKLVRLFNRSNIGVTAQKITDSKGMTAITIESQNTGDADGKGSLFSITNNDKSDEDVVFALGLNNVLQEPANAKFTINGVEHTASSNEFSVSHQYRLTLNNVSLGGETVNVGVKQDFDSILENVNELISTYNNMVNLAVDRSKDSERDGSRLMNDIKAVSGYYKNSLESAGFNVDDDGHIKVEESILEQSAREGKLSESLEKLNLFKKAVVNKADDISLDPMKYVNKKMISYPNPNPAKNFTSPYVSSIYSGLMFNGYI